MTGPLLYRVNPSGAVVLLNPSDGNRDHHATANADDSLEMDQNQRRGASSMGYHCDQRRGSAAFLGNWDALHRSKNVDNTRRQLEDERYATEGEVKNALIDVAKRTFVVDDESLGVVEGGGYESSGDGARRRTKLPILFASFSRERGLRVSRIMSE